MKNFTKECEADCTEECETDCEKEGGVTSIVIETDEDKTKMVALYGPVEEEKCEELVSSFIVLEALVKEEDGDPIKFLISSEGGAAYEMFSVYDAMRALKKKATIETIGVGKVMSAAVLLLAAGTKGERKIGKHCRVMVHDVKAGQSGTVGNMEIAQTDRIQKMIYGFANFPFGRALHLGTKTNVFTHAHPFEQCALLENHTTFCAWPCDG